jgi:hypothetical protein
MSKKKVGTTFCLVLKWVITHALNWQKKKGLSSHSCGYEERTLFMIYLMTASDVNYVT